MLRLRPVTHKGKTRVLIHAALPRMPLRSGITMIEAVRGKKSFPEDVLTQWLSLRVHTSICFQGVASL